MRFKLLVEGFTEKTAAGDFLKRWLDLRLKKPVGIDVVRFDGNADFVRKIVKTAQKHLDGPGKSEIVAVIGLLDLYGLDIYPDDKTTVRERNDWGVKQFESIVARKNFRMFFAVHEFEAWLLSQPDIFPPAVRKGLPKKTAQPENVNFTEPPAELLNKLYRKQLKKDYKKTVNGLELFRNLDPAVAVGKCPYLKAMLEEMLKLAKAAGL